MKLFYSIALTLLCTICTAQMKNQDQDDLTNDDETIFRINLITPSLELERDLTSTLSLVGNVGVGIYYYNQDNFFGKREGLLLPLRLETAVRSYTNFKRRLSKEKTIENNSGNYISLKFAKEFQAENEDVFLRESTYLAANYGIQRTYWNHLNFNVEGGPGYDFQNDEFVVIGVLKLGYTF